MGKSFRNLSKTLKKFTRLAIDDPVFHQPDKKTVRMCKIIGESGLKEIVWQQSKYENQRQKPKVLVMEKKHVKSLTKYLKKRMMIIILNSQYLLRLHQTIQK